MGSLHGLEHENASSLAHDESIPVLVERAAGPGRLVVEGGAHCLHRTKPRKADAGDGGLAATRQHDVSFAVDYFAERFADGMGAGGAGADDAEIRSASADIDRDDPTGDVGDEGRNHERRHLAGTALEHGAHLPFDGFHATDAGTNEYPQSRLVALVEIEGGVLHRESSGPHRELSVTVVSAGFLGIHVVGWIEIIHFRSDS